MKHVEILLTCDGCLAWDGAETTAGVESVALVGGYTLDLCAPHRDRTAEAIALIAAYAGTAEGTAHAAPARRAPRGGKREATRRAAAEAEAVAEAVVVVGGLVCPVCAESAPSSDAMGRHLGHAHGLTPVTVYGLSCPLCGKDLATGRALGAHGRREHGTTDGVPGLFALAISEGDPLGVVAARAASLAEAAGD